VSDDPLPADPVKLGCRRQVAYHLASILTIVGHRDPAVHLGPQRVALQPAVDGGVELDVTDLRESRVRVDAQPRYAVL
jgi:hypothetical protein